MDVSSSSSSSSSSSLPTIDVFLNFRGEDTRKNFVCHLRRALDRRGVKVYLDNLDLRRGKDLLDLLEAIAKSKISIVVFSENYAASKWCLKELVKILECKANQKQIVIPIFYRVDPSDIREQTGSFAKAFAEHERDPKKDKKEVQRWRSALREAANLAGWDSENYEDDVKLIRHIVKVVFDMLNQISPHSHTEDGLVAIDSHLHEMRRRLSDAPDDIDYIGIWGMGGVGKTMIANAFYREIAQQFDQSCFLENVREGFTRKGEVQMQLQFVSGIWKTKFNDLESHSMMLERLRNKKILVVLDDVIDSSQIDTLLGEQRAFGGGSVIIVTTRDVHVVHGFKIYEPQLLIYRDALKLFSLNAFKTYEPSEGYGDLSRCIVEYAHGLPLALKVLGRLLSGRSVSKWAAWFKNRGKRPYRKIIEVLETSYDELDESLQNRFLDIACFFKGMDKEYVTTVLVSCGASFASSELDELVERALVTISDSNKLEMHDLLQEMGRYIESTKAVGIRSRFWSAYAGPVLSENPATESAVGLRIDWLNQEDNQEDRSSNAEAFVHMRKLKLLIFTYGQMSGKHVLSGFWTRT